MQIYSSGEDYLEAVLILQKKLGEVRSVDIARYVGVSKPSVCHAVNILCNGGFLTRDDSFCNLEENGVKERREQQIAERYEGRADERVTSTEANAVVKDVGKTDRKPAQQKQAVDGKDKKLSIHERLEINKRIIQEKQGKDKPEREADRDVRQV